MRFGTFPLFKASGLHLTVPVACRGKVFERGHVLSNADLALLRYEDVAEVTGFIPEKTDLAPDTALTMLLKSLAGEYVRYTNPHDGYAEVYADADGVFFADAERLTRFNAHTEDVSLATIAPYTPVYKNQLIGSVRIVSPLIVNDTVDELMTKMAGLGALLKIRPYRFRKTALITTKISTDEEFVPDAPDERVLKKLTACGFNLMPPVCCPHTVPDIEKNVCRALDAGAEIVLTVSEYPPQHRQDIVPEAFKESAADIDRLGLPFDPVLNIVFARKKETTLVGIGAQDFFAPAFDRILRFLAAKTLPDITLFPSLATNSVDLQRSIQFLTPEQEADSVAVGAEDASDKIAVLILAAGQSRRMLGRNKLLQPLFGLPMIDRVVRSALSSKADYVYVVTGHQAEIVERRLKRYDVKTVRNPEYASGVLGSARLGLSVLPPDVAGALVLPADMPGFTEEYIDMLIDAFDPQNGKKMCLPTLNGVRHNPVLWAKSLFPIFKIIPEDAHWSPALVEHTDYMVEIPVADEVALTDVNTQGDLAAFQENIGDSEGAEMELDALGERMGAEKP